MDKPVYSTDTSTEVSKKNTSKKSTSKKSQKSKASPRPEHGKVKIHRERRGGGKVVSIVNNIPLSLGDLNALKKDLQSFTAGGASVKGNEIHLQGDHVQRAIEYFLKKGVQAVQSGG